MDDGVCRDALRGHGNPNEPLLARLTEAGTPRHHRWIG